LEEGTSAAGDEDEEDVVLPNLPGQLEAELSAPEGVLIWNWVPRLDDLQSFRSQAASA